MFNSRERLEEIEATVTRLSRDLNELKSLPVRNRLSKQADINGVIRSLLDYLGLEIEYHDEYYELKRRDEEEDSK